ncbi:hypothetical protein B0I35DRAFT_429333 [Stachybotrys elegans]|uniref:Uncharacterized protein n=1 Tax=Stachybotrys elegans TaxID=80388 RepID=A0A8K0WQX8_9HYPO|nr:hypothetical protein B0I35DRAFT_429333 [Stachybotrys elegans]
MVAPQDGMRKILYVGTYYILAVVWPGRGTGGHSRLLSIDLVVDWPIESVSVCPVPYRSPAIRASREQQDMAGCSTIINCPPTDGPRRMRGRMRIGSGAFERKRGKAEEMEDVMEGVPSRSARLHAPAAWPC